VSARSACAALSCLRRFVAGVWAAGSSLQGCRRRGVGSRFLRFLVTRATAPPSLRLELADVVDAREIVLDGEIAVPNYRGVTDIDDLQDAIAGNGRLEPL
jgi:hypothetical protein